MKIALPNVLALLVASAGLIASAQDSTKTATPKPAEKPAAAKSDEKKVDAKQEDKTTETKKTDEKKSSNRLPSNYGKLGLSDAQKAKVYGIQDKHEKEIEALNEKLKAAKAKRDSEIEAVLTPEQKKTLAEITSAKDEGKGEGKGSK